MNFCELFFNFTWFQKKDWIYNKQNNYQYDSVESIKNDKWKKNTNKIPTIFVLVHWWMILLVNQPRYDEWHANIMILKTYQMLFTFW
mgnify:CR=1 FL=1